MKLSSRQKLLLSRLVALGSQARQRQLPVEVTEIFGFGSFFRGKQRPKDVDLLICHTCEHGRAFSSFQAILEHIAADVRYQYDFDRPLAAFLDEYDRRHANMLPGLVSVDEERELFQRWLEPYSWPMLFPKCIGDACAWEDPCGVTRRLLRRRVPNVNVAYFIFPDRSPDQIGLRAGFTELIWSHDQPDISDNVMAALAPDRVLANTQKEFRNFDRQLFLLRATLAMLEQCARQALKEHPPETGASRLPHGLLCAETLMTESQVTQELGKTYQCRGVDDLGQHELGELVEQHRAGVKDLWNRVESTRQAIGLMNRYWRWTERRPNIPIEKFVAGELGSGKTAAQRRIVSTVLSSLGIETS
ncbi:MAG TPA: hypothetical protein VHC22_21805 [Pirellulales bacterium]|nr:hypothetical protein [Pirellulales bacterium]